MRALMLALALAALPAFAQNGPPTVVGEIVKLRQSVGELRGQVADLTTRLAAAEAQAADLKLRMNRVENSYNIALYYAYAQLCYANSMQSTWITSLAGLKPFQMPGTFTCPPAGEKIYVPDFIGGVGAVLKPPAQ